MGYKSKFTTPAENAMTHFSGWSGVNCETCKRGTTKAQLLYTLRVYDLYKCLSLGIKYHDDTTCVCMICYPTLIIIPRNFPPG